MKKIAIIGAGGFVREVKMLIDQINNLEEKYLFIGYFDDSYKIGTVIFDSTVIGSINDINLSENSISLVIAIGEPEIKERIIKSITNPKISYETLIHPNIQIGITSHNIIGQGTIITAGNIITVNTKIGRHVILNLNCTVGHDTEIGDYCSIMPGVNISGEVTLSTGVYIGTGATIINRINIGEYTTIGAGALVSKSIPSNCIAVGIPAKPIKFK